MDAVIILTYVDSLLHCHDCAGDHSDETLCDHLQIKSEEMEDERKDGAQRELVRDDMEPPRGECESIVHPQNPDGDVEVSLY